MKNKIILLIILLAFPIFINASGIDSYDMRYEVLKNGDLLIEEAFILNGSYNGYERIINYRNPNLKLFDGSLSSFAGSDIYNGTGIIIEEIKVFQKDKFISFQNNDVENLKKVREFYKNNGYSVEYDYVDTANGKNIKIYNPSYNGYEVFYLRYVIKDVVVLHNDIAEVAFNVFTSLRETVKRIKIEVVIPNNQNILRAWAHGPLNGDINLIGKNKVLFEIKLLDKNTPFDIRFAFDKEILLSSAKKSSVDGLDKIIEYETKKAEEVNLIRERNKNVSIFFDILRLSWLIGLILLIKHVYIKHDREHASEFKGKYFRDFPENYGPGVVAYLLKRKIDISEMSAMILDLINRKVIGYEEVKKGGYVFLKKEHKEILSKSEEKLMTILFDEIGVDNKVDIKTINNYAKKHYEKFFNLYDGWKDEVLLESTSYDFYEENFKIKTKAILYSVLGIVLVIVPFIYVNWPLISILSFIASLIAIVYFATFIKRTKLGNEQYSKWVGLKNFLNDFGNFKERDLPHIELWNKYLVYAVVFGNATKLSKKMKIKMKEMNVNNNQIFVNNLYTYHLLDLNRSLTTSMTNAVNNAHRAKLNSQSRYSSGGGFGGGFSGGGGSFGGGGGGGRF